MNKQAGKELFIFEIANLMKTAIEDQNFEFDGLSQEAYEYFLSFKDSLHKKPEITEKGMEILKTMKEMCEEAGNEASFSAKEIGDYMGVSGRAVSGSIRKLIELNLVEKQGENPTKYRLTPLGFDK